MVTSQGKEVLPVGGRDHDGDVAPRFKDPVCNLLVRAGEHRQPSTEDRAPLGRVPSPLRQPEPPASEGFTGLHTLLR